MHVKIFTEAVQYIQNALAYIAKDNRNYYKFGADDKLPNEIVDRVNDSGTARACINRLTQFTQGLGFLDNGIATGKLNLMQSGNSVLYDLCLIVSYSKCVSFRVLFDNEGNPARIYPTQTQQFRRKGKKTFIYNELMGEVGYRRRDDKYLQAFDPAESVQKRIERMQSQISNYGDQYGDVIYHFKKGVGRYQDVYPIPGYYSGIDDIESDAGVSRLEKRNIQKGWKAQVFISTGPLDHNTKDEGGKTQYDKFAETVKKFTTEDASTILHLEGATNEVKPDVKIMDVAGILDQTEKATDRIGRKVCRHMGVPPVLVGFETAGKLGDIQELENTMQLFRLTVIESQELIKEALNIVFPGKSFEISPLTLWTKPNEAPKV